MEEVVFTSEQKALISELEAYADATIDSETKQLRELVDIIRQAVDIRMVNGQIVTDVSLSSNELEALAMRIPAECLYLQSRLNQYSVKNTFRDMQIDAQMTVSLAKLIGAKGTADERKRRVEQELLTEKVQNAVNKLIIKGIQGCIDRADKAYEGIKKVMDYRSKEGWFDRKGV